MNWSSGVSGELLVRRVRDRLTTEQALLRAVILAIRGELIDARGTDPTVADRLTAIEARLAALEPPNP